MVLSSLKMDLDAYLSTNILDAFAETISIGNHHIDVVVVIGVFGVGVLTPGTGMGLYFAVIKVLALSQLSSHVGYLHTVRAFLMCSSSLGNSWG